MHVGWFAEGSVHSVNKPAQTAEEAAYVAIVATLPCVVCGSQPVEVHEWSQGDWWTAVPLCFEDHRGRDGWHGTRTRWTLRKVTMLSAIASTVRSVFRIVLSMPLSVNRKVKVKEPRPSKLGRPQKIHPRRQFEEMQ
jgi:hypothetical protein